MAATLLGNAPELSEAKKLRQWEAKQRLRTKEVTIPALDMGLLTRQYGPDAYDGRFAHAQQLEGTFTCPIDASGDQYTQTRNHAVERFIAAMDRQGWDIALEQRMSVRPGVYPARDIEDGSMDFGRREFIITGHFSQRHPKFHKIELPPEIVHAMTIHADGRLTYGE